MAKTATQKKQPAPQPTAVEEDNQAAPVETQQVATHGGMHTPVVRASLWNRQEQDATGRLSRKAELLGSVGQKLAMAADLSREGEEAADEVTKIVDGAATELFKGVKAGLLVTDEVSALLGDKFGYKPKSDGTPGKTPAGAGEAVRKRVMRAVQANAYVEEGEGGRFFEGLPEDKVEEIIDQIDAGAISIWAAYGKFADIKKENTTRIDFAYDPRKIAGLVEQLSKDGTANMIASSPALVAAYSSLYRVLTMIGEAGAPASETVQ